VVSVVSVSNKNSSPRRKSSGVNSAAQPCPSHFTFPPDEASLAAAAAVACTATSAPPHSSPKSTAVETSASRLSSVLHVQECNVSSDGFHETLFIEKSPSKQQQSLKKRRKSKKAKEQEGRQDGKALRESRIDRKEGKARVKREENRTRNSKKEDQ